MRTGPGASFLVALAALAVAACGASATGLGPQPSCGAAPQASLGCVPSITVAPGGLSEPAAIAAARALVPGGSDAAVVWAHVEPNPFIRPEGPLVWEVRLAGQIAYSPCPAGWLDHVPTPSDPACLDNDSGVIVVLDHYSGAFLGWLH